MRRVARRLLRAALAVGLVAGCAPGGEPPDDPALPDLEPLVARSGWIFEGTVAALHDANQGSPDPARSIIVRVDRVSVEPLEAPLPPGTLDTIELAAPPGDDLALGSRAYFFVGDEQAGQHWLFREEGHLDVAALAFDDLHARVHTIKRRLLDRALLARMQSADRVLRGTVTAVTDLPDGPGPLDGPDWWEATVQPRNTLRGPVEVDPIAVRFDAAGERLEDPPRLEVGVQSILLLQPDTVSGHGPGLVVTDPLDVQPAHELERLRSLLASPPT
ncbi:MAG TPA: hypothetical protein VHE35_09080 [Kofleriaceae bacterium]|nr:hypothetical protein [Kofleriaceae bacterium]